MLLLSAALALAIEDQGFQDAKRWADLAELYRQLPEAPKNVGDAVARRQAASQALQRIYAQLAEREQKLEVHLEEVEEDADAGLQALARMAGAQAGSPGAAGQGVGQGTAGQPGVPQGVQGRSSAQGEQPLSYQAARALMDFSAQRVAKELRYEQFAQETEVWVNQEKEGRGCEDEACEKAVEQQGLEKKETALNLMLNGYAQGFKTVTQLLEKAGAMEAKAILALGQKGEWVLGSLERSAAKARDRISQTGMAQHLVGHLRSAVGYLADWFTRALELREVDTSGFQEPDREGTHGSGRAD